jgi:hypothetical protein
MTHEELVDLLAAEVHAMWARWMAWVFTVSFPVNNGGMLIPAEDVRRWMRQVETPYAQLRSSEQESDLREVRGYLLPIIERYAQEQADQTTPAAPRIDPDIASTVEHDIHVSAEQIEAWVTEDRERHRRRGD